MNSFNLFPTLDRKQDKQDSLPFRAVRLLVEYHQAQAKDTIRAFAAHV